MLARSFHRRPGERLFMPSYYRAAARGVRWDELFSGFPGVAYDKTRVESLTQDRGALTPVTAAAQSIGLAHDYARAASGWVSGTELVTNGDGNSAVGWTVSNCSVASVGGVLRATQTVAPFFVARTQITGLTAGRIYSFSVTFAAITGCINSQIWIGTSGSAQDLLVNRGSVAAGTVTGVFVAGSSTRLVEIVGNAPGGSGVIDFYNISVKEITGNPLLAPTDARRPTWGAMANGLPCSVWDGTRAMATAAPVDFSSTDEITVMAAVRKTSDAAAGILAELSAAFATNTGTFYIAAPETTGAGGNYTFNSRGNSNGVFVSSGVLLAPHSAIVVCRARISTPIRSISVNGSAQVTNTGSQGTGNYGNHTMNIGARNAASPSLFFNGQFSRAAFIGGNIGAERYAAMLGLTMRDFAPT